MISDIKHNMSANDLKDFDDWTLSIGNGELKEVHLTDEMVTTIIAKNSKERYRIIFAWRTHSDSYSDGPLL